MRFGFDIVWWLVDTTDWDELTFAEINLNYNHHFNTVNNTHFYGIATLGYHYYKGKINTGWGTMTVDDSEIALGVGVGMEIEVNPARIYVEPRYFFSGYDQLGISGGVRFGF